jgi:hypothetical protein
MAETENRSGHLRPAEDVLADLWSALWRVDTIRSLELTTLSMSMNEGDLLLEGHLASETNLGRIRTIAQDTPGVLAIHDHLILDQDLAVEVAQALSGDERTRPFVLPVSCDHGWIRMGGAVPDRQAQLAAEEVAAQVPHGRGVVTLPSVTGQPSTSLRRALQPRPGARVWGEDGEVGQVARVVIDPHNRLVTHVVVSSTEVRDFRRLEGDYVVPVGAIEIANHESVFLAHPYRSITRFPAFDAGAYPQAAANWTPPYPYKAEVVRWRREAHRSAAVYPGDWVQQSGVAHAAAPDPSLDTEGGLDGTNIGIREGGAS